jgi:hypothetical protein
LTAEVDGRELDERDPWGPFSPLLHKLNNNTKKKWLVIINEKMYPE